MKKLIAVLIALVLVLSLAACAGGDGGTTKSGEQSENTEPSGKTEQSENTEPSGKTEQSGKTEPSGGISVDVGKELVTITIPDEFVDDELSEEDILAETEEEGILDVVINEDGSVTYTMTREKHDELMKEMSDGIEKALEEMLNGEEEISFKEITHNEDFSVLEITVDPDLYTEFDDLNAMILTMVGAQYQVYAGNSEPESEVILKDALTGEELSRSSYSELQELFNSFMSEFEEGFDFDDYGYGQSWDYPLELPEIEEQVLLDEGGVKVTATGLENGPWGPCLNVEIENNSETAVYIDTSCFFINDYNMFTGLYATAAPGETLSDYINLPTNAIEAAGITEIGKIELGLVVFDDETYEELFRSENVVIRTSDYDKNWQVAPQGDTIIDSDNVIISYLGMKEDDYWGYYNIYFYFENNADTMIEFSGDILSINGIDREDWVFETVEPGMRAVGIASIDVNELPDLTLEDFDSVEIKFELYDYFTYDLLAEFDTVDILAD